jgi:hypothetical protein
MKHFSLLLIAAGLGSCVSAPPSPELVARQQAKIASLTAGKIAGAPTSCLPTYRSDDMIVIDDDTIAFRNGSNRVYINHMMGPCNGVSRGNALVTRTTETRLCRGDIAQVVDVASRTTLGSCSFGDFIPYTRAG